MRGPQQAPPAYLILRVSFFFVSLPLAWIWERQSPRLDLLEKPRGIASQKGQKEVKTAKGQNQQPSHTVYWEGKTKSQSQLKGREKTRAAFSQKRIAKRARSHHSGRGGMLVNIPTPGRKHNEEKKSRHMSARKKERARERECGQDHWSRE